MKVSKTGDIRGYFDNFFKQVEATQHEQEYRAAWKIVAEFGEFIDQMARSNPHKLHHVYEWNMVGHRNARLFELNVVPTSAGCVINYQFLKSVMPNDNGYVFEDKAEVMESGQEVSFETEKVVPLYNGEMFRTGPFTFIPGGKDVAGSFEEMYRTFFLNKENLIAVNRGMDVRISELTTTGGTRDGRSFYDRIIN